MRISWSVKKAPFNGEPANQFSLSDSLCLGYYAWQGLLFCVFSVILFHLPSEYDKGEDNCGGEVEQDGHKPQLCGFVK